MPPPPAPPEPADPKCAELHLEAEEIRAQLALAPQRRALILQLSVQREQYQAAEHEKNSSLVATLGIALKALEQQSDALPLSENECQTLPGRRDEVVRRMDHMCGQLASAQRYEELRSMAVARDFLQALNMSA